MYGAENYLLYSVEGEPAVVCVRGRGTGNYTVQVLEDSRTSIFEPQCMILKCNKQCKHLQK